MRCFRRSVLPCVVLSAWLIVAGCGDDDGDPVSPGATAPRDAENPTELVGLLVLAIESRDVEAVDRLLHPDYRFFFSSADVDQVGRILLDRPAEIATLRTMFSPAPFGQANFALETLEFLSFGPVGSGWVALFDDLEFPDADRRAVYEARLEVAVDGGSLGVSGRWELFTKTEQIDVEGTPTTVTRLVGWRDLGIALRSSDTESWGALKGLYLTLAD